jgi:hypothetical protein
MFAASMFAVLILVPISTVGQFTADKSIGQEMRPFDFKDAYYEKNGVSPRMILNRRTGFDKNSTIDFINSDIHRNVRITGTWPMDDYKGDVSFVAPLGDLPIDGFTRDKIGKNAKEIAYAFPYYVFPSTEFRGTDRQATVAETEGSYFEKNPLGLSVVVKVEFTPMAFTPEGQEVLDNLIGKNGKTLDGTFAIRKVSEIKRLTWLGYITQRMWKPGDESNVAFKIKYVIENPTRGAISPDAQLNMVLDRNQSPLFSEMIFVRQFKCLQTTGRWCR